MSDKNINPKGAFANYALGSWLKKFDIAELNPMQLEAGKAIRSKSDVVLHSPTGSGKTLAFLLPLMESLDIECTELQVLILVPSRELAQQIEQVARKMGTGFKVNAVYGGRAGLQDRLDLKQLPAILIGTPGRVADRIRRDNFSLEHIHGLVLDEYDKSLEIGFENEMKAIVASIPNVKQRILTSATHKAELPGFVHLQNEVIINYQQEAVAKLEVKVLLSPEKDKLKSLKNALEFLGPQAGIIFCNHKEALGRVSSFLTKNQIGHQCFHGDMEQKERERSLIKFRNGTNQLLLATDLAARGLDIPEIKFILHYHLPLHAKGFTHRNGRTARMKRDGVAYILHFKEEQLPDFIQEIDPEKLDIEGQPKMQPVPTPAWKTLYITGGRRDKISKGDIAGLFLKQGLIKKEQLGLIELKQDAAYVAVDAALAEKLAAQLNNSKLKKKKVRISVI